MYKLMLNLCSTLCRSIRKHTTPKLLSPLHTHHSDSAGITSRSECSHITCKCVCGAWCVCIVCVHAFGINIASTSMLRGVESAAGVAKNDRIKDTILSSNVSNKSLSPTPARPSHPLQNGTPSPTTPRRMPTKPNGPAPPTPSSLNTLEPSTLLRVRCQT